MSNYTVQVDIRRKVVVFEELLPRDSMPGGHDEEWWRLNFRQFASLRFQWQQVKERLSKWLDAKKNLNSNLNESVEVPRLRRFIELQNLEADKLSTSSMGMRSEILCRCSGVHIDAASPYSSLFFEHPAISPLVFFITAPFNGRPNNSQAWDCGI